MFLVHSTHEEAPLLAQAVVTACKGPDGWETPLQPRLLHVLFERLVGLDVDFELRMRHRPSVNRPFTSRRDRMEDRCLRGSTIDE